MCSADGRFLELQTSSLANRTTVTQSGNDPFATAANNNSGLNLARGATAQIRTDLIGDPHGPKTAAEFFNTAAFATAVGHFGDGDNLAPFWGLGSNCGTSR